VILLYRPLVVTAVHHHVATAQLVLLDPLDSIARAQTDTMEPLVKTAVATTHVRMAVLAAMVEMTTIVHASPVTLDKIASSKCATSVLTSLMNWHGVVLPTVLMEIKVLSVIVSNILMKLIGTAKIPSTQTVLTFATLRIQIRAHTEMMVCTWKWMFLLVTTVVIRIIPKTTHAPPVTQWTAAEKTKCGMIPVTTKFMHALVRVTVLST
jgi:hypothetical protein